MKLVRPVKLIQAIVVTAFALFGANINHLGIAGASSMSGMAGMPDHTTTATSCRFVCTEAVQTKSPQNISRINKEDNNDEPNSGVLASLSLSLVALIFVVKRLHHLSSWRPPDLLALYGHYGDGL